MTFASNGIYTPPTGAENAAPGKTIASATWNSIFTDLSTALTQLGQGTFAPPTTALTLANGLNSNIALPATLRSRITGPTGAFSVGGFTGGSDGVRLWLYNPTNQVMTIVNEDGSSTAANRIHTLTGQNYILFPGDTFATLSYDGTDNRWILESVNDGGPQIPSGGYTSNYAIYQTAVNFNASAGSDIATFTIPLPIGVTNYLVNNIRIGNAAATLNSVTVSLYTGAGATGSTVISSTATTITTSTAAMIMVPTSASTQSFNSSSLFLHVTASTVSSTADVILQITPLY